MGASVGVGGLIVGTSLMVVFALAITTLDVRMDSSLDALDSANEPLPSFIIDDATMWEGAVVSLTIVDSGAGYTAGTLSTAVAGGFTATFSVNSTGGIVNPVTITSHGNYSSPPTIQIDGPQPGVTSPATITASLGTVIHTNVTNDGPVTLSHDDVWFFVDGTNARSMNTLVPGPSSNWYSGETVKVEWRGFSSSSFTTMAVSSHGHNLARALD
ncbi:MAG: hypothetical protein QF479_04685 [Candidatus Poseidoniaceae archaeon]|nr:hypothetical protein [Candidatus Poseidoniaceae archaeon]